MNVRRKFARFLKSAENDAIVAKKSVDGAKMSLGKILKKEDHLGVPVRDSQMRD